MPIDHKALVRVRNAELRRKEQRARKAMQPFRLAVNAALKSSGVARAGQGRNGRIAGIGTTHTTGWLTETMVWSEPHGVEVRLESRDIPTFAKADYILHLKVEAQTLWAKVVAALKADPRFVVSDVRETSLVVRPGTSFAVTQ